MHEFHLRDRLARNLQVVEPNLQLVETEHAFPGGRIDILARQRGENVAIELKSKPYDTRRVCAQLMHYCARFPRVYFVAPKVRFGVCDTLHREYSSGKLRLYEISTDPLRCTRVYARDLDDTRPFPTLTSGIDPEDMFSFFVEEAFSRNPFAKTLLHEYRNLIKA